MSRSSWGGLTFWNSLASIELAISSSDRGMLFAPPNNKYQEKEKEKNIQCSSSTYLISSSSKNVLSEALPSFTSFFISSSTYNQPTSSSHLTFHRMNPYMHESSNATSRINIYLPLQIHSQYYICHPSTACIFCKSVERSTPASSQCK